MLKTIFITQGEPSGIGTEIITKSLLNWDFEAYPVQFYILGDKDLFPSFASPFIKFKSYNLGQVEFGKASTKNARIILNMIRDASLLTLETLYSAMVTAPIYKPSLTQIEPDFRGHTDYIAEVISEKLSRTLKPVMMLSSKELKVVPLTVHIPLMNVKNALKKESFMHTIEVISHDLRKKYHIENPHIAVAGLNPHAGDEGVMGNEEQEFLNEWVKEAKQDYNISGCYAADTLFHKKAREKYDVALCMYHDQALIPIKTLAFDEGVNVTLGLPIIRTSPDHGTAFDIAGKNIANPLSFTKALVEAYDSIPNVS